VLPALGCIARELWRKLTPHSPPDADPTMDERRVLAEERKVLVAALDADFKAMRAEIGRLIDHQKDLHNLSFVSLAALLAFIGALVRQGPGSNLTVVLLLVPLLTLQFTLTASDLTRRILQLARYLNEVTSDVNEILRPILPAKVAQRAVDGQAVWKWESWKSRDHWKNPGLFQGQVWMLEKSRWLALTFPGVTAVVAYWLLDETPLGSDVEKWLFAAAVIMLLISVISLLVYRPEARGVVDRTR
jgi:small basic protein